MSEGVKPLSPDTIIKFISDQYIHQDRLYWQQIRTIGLIEAASFAGVYAMRGSSLVYAVAGIGAAYLLVLYLYTIRLSECRDVNLKAADAIMNTFGDPKLVELLKADDDPRLMRFTKPVGKFWSLRTLYAPSIRGRHILNVTLFASVALNFVIAAYFKEDGQTVKASAPAKEIIDVGRGADKSPSLSAATSPAQPTTTPEAKP